MASTAGPPSGRGIDVNYVLAQVIDRIEDVEASWDRIVRIAPEGRGIMIDFAHSALLDLNQRGLPPNVDEGTLVRQVDKLVPEFLETIRSEAQERRAMLTDAVGVSEIPGWLIDQRLPTFMAQRCPCYPQ